MPKDEFKSLFKVAELTKSLTIPKDVFKTITALNNIDFRSSSAISAIDSALALPKTIQSIPPVKQSEVLKYFSELKPLFNNMAQIQNHLESIPLNQLKNKVVYEKKLRREITKNAKKISVNRDSVCIPLTLVHNSAFKNSYKDEPLKKSDAKPLTQANIKTQIVSESLTKEDAKSKVISVPPFIANIIFPLLIACISWSLGYTYNKASSETLNKLVSIEKEIHCDIKEYRDYLITSTHSNEDELKESSNYLKTINYLLEDNQSQPPSSNE
jgi:hypothetical protein